VDISELRRVQREFVRERDWEQFHTPKNIAMALGGEVGELAEAISRLKYRSTNDAYDPSSEVIDEVGDVTLYLLRLHDLLGIPVVTGADLTDESQRLPRPVMLINAVFKLMASVGRILESYQWVAGDECLSSKAHERAANRVVVATQDLVTVCSRLKVDPIAAATQKLEKNRQKYPVETSRGTSRKYTEMGEE